MPSASLAGSGGTEAAWQHGSSPAEEELMEKLRAECSVEGGQEVKNWKVSLLSRSLAGVRGVVRRGLGAAVPHRKGRVSFWRKAFREEVSVHSWLGITIDVT